MKSYCSTLFAHLPLGLLQTRPQLGLLPLDGGTSLFQHLSVLQQSREILLQLLLLLLQLENLTSKD